MTAISAENRLSIIYYQACQWNGYNINSKKKKRGGGGVEEKIR